MMLGYPGKNSAVSKVGSVICLKRATKYFLVGVRKNLFLSQENSVYIWKYATGDLVHDLY